MQISNRLKKHSTNIALPDITSDETLALTRAGVEVAKQWVDNQPDDLTSLQILAEMHNLTMLAVTDPLIRNRILTLIKILKEEETINNG